VLTDDWTKYLATQFNDIIPGSAQDAMHMVGAIEIVAGLVVLVAPRFGGALVAAWLGGIILNLLLVGGYGDVALRDFGLLLGALALTRLAAPSPARARVPASGRAMPPAPGRRTRRPGAPARCDRTPELETLTFTIDRPGVRGRLCVGECRLLRGSSCSRLCSWQGPVPRAPRPSPPAAAWSRST
jgi:hypothetical protein